MKKIIVSLVLACLFLTSCGSSMPPSPETAPAHETEPGTVETSLSEMTSRVSDQIDSGLKPAVSLKDAVENLPYIARVIITSEPQAAVNQHFAVSASVVENFRGVEEKEITIRADDSSLQKGGRYTLFMEKHESVIEDTSYYVCGETVYSLGDRLFADSIHDISELNEEQFLEKLRETVSRTDYIGGKWIRGAYIHSTDIDTVMKECSHIAEVTILSLQQIGEDRELAVCSPLKSLKGDLPASFQTIVPLHSVAVGDHFVLMLRKVDGIFALASPNSIFRSESDEAAHIRKQFP